MRRCSSAISIQEIFEGDVDQSMRSLNDSIQCGVEWKSIYMSTKEAIRKRHSNEPRRHWNFDAANIFAQIDAFVQRCRDLLEVCEGQLQFARQSINLRKGLDPKAALPVFAGSHGPETLRALIDIEHRFDTLLHRLKSVDYWILDVKSTKWHEDYNAFKNAVKDLEVMMQTHIGAAFETVETVELGVQYLEAFTELAQRESIERCVQLKTAHVYDLFRNQLDRHRTEFEERRQNPPLRSTEPKFSGAGMWAEGILRQITYDATCLEKANLFSKNQRATQDAMRMYRDFKKTLEDYIAKQYQDWMACLQSMEHTQFQSLLEKPLLKMLQDDEATSGAEEEDSSKESSSVDNMIKDMSEKNSTTMKTSEDKTSSDSEGLIEANFDKSLIRVFNEVKHWERFEGDLRVVIPYVAQDISQQRDQMRMVRMHVLLVVRGYNDILNKLSIEERKLFREHLRRLDRRVSPGFNQLNWSSADVSEWFVKDSLRQCDELSKIVDAFHESKEMLHSLCERVVSTKLIDIQKNRVYNANEFSKIHHDLRTKVTKEFMEIHESILSSLETSYEFFANDSTFVQKQWIAFVRSIDERLKHAFVSVIKKTLSEISKIMNGDKKTEPQSVFGMNLMLQRDLQGVYNLGCNPSMADMSELLKMLCDETMSCISKIPRLIEALNTGRNGLSRSILRKELTAKDEKSFFDTVSSDPDILKILASIQRGKEHGAKQLHDWLEYWLKYVLSVIKSVKILQIEMAGSLLSLSLFLPSSSLSPLPHPTFLTHYSLMLYF